MLIFKLKDIVMDIELENPKFYDIGEPWKRINDQKDLTQVNDSHCIRAF